MRSRKCQGEFVVCRRSSNTQTDDFDGEFAHSRGAGAGFMNTIAVRVGRSSLVRTCRAKIAASEACHWRPKAVWIEMDG